MTSSTSSPLAMSMSPTGFNIQHTGNFAGHVTVRDAGTSPVTVRPVAIRVGVHAANCKQGPPSWLKVDPTAFTLKPGQSHAIPFTVDALPGQTGTGAVLAVGSASGGKHVTAAIGAGAQVKLGDGAQVCTKPVSLPAPSSGGAPLALVLGLPLVLVALLALVAVVVRRRRAS